MVVPSRSDECVCCVLWVEWDWDEVWGLERELLLELEFEDEEWEE